MTGSIRLPARPSLHQLQKQAKDLLRQVHASDSAAVARFQAAGLATSAAAEPKSAALADAQLVLAREYGFKSWAELKHHIEALRPSTLKQFEDLARDLAQAYSTGDARAVREINWSLGTSFISDRNPSKMQEQLTTWIGSAERSWEDALADARRMVAHAFGLENWTEFTASLGTMPKSGRRRPQTSQAALYTIDETDHALSVRGPQSEKDWDAILNAIEEHRVVRLNAGGVTDAGMERVSRAGCLTSLNIGNSGLLTDDGLLKLARMPLLEEVDVGGPKGLITDRGLTSLSALPNLRRLKMYWQPNITDAGVSNLASCEKLESVDLMGTFTGDGALRALAGKPRLRQLKTGRNITDAGLELLGGFPGFSNWQGGEEQYGLMTADVSPSHLMLDGPFTGAGIARLVSLAALQGLFGLSFFWHCSNITGDDLGPLIHLPNLGAFGCDGARCDDHAMRHIAAMPRLRKLMAQGTVATDAGFGELSGSQAIEHIWGRECPNLTGPGFAALAEMPSLRGLAVSCRNVDDAALSLLPRFPSLVELMPMDVSDDGFRHIGQCERLQSLWCMYCRETGDAATEHIAGLSSLESYYAGRTRISDRSLEILSTIQSLERIQLWGCDGVTDAGVAKLAGLSRLTGLVLDNLPGVTRRAATAFAPHVRVTYSG